MVSRDEFIKAVEDQDKQQIVDMYLLGFNDMFNDETFVKEIINLLLSKSLENSRDAIVEVYFKYIERIISNPLTDHDYINDKLSEMQRISSLIF